MKRQPLLISNDPALLESLRPLVPSKTRLTLIESAADCRQAPLCQWLDRAALGPRAQVKVAIDDAIATLERTRHAFRSQELADLRKRLTLLGQTLSADNE